MSTQRTDIYQTPLTDRYSSYKMQHLFSDDVKFSTWRQLWIALAEAENELGVENVTEEKIEEMKKFVNEINYDVARAREKKVRHDVMSHVYAYGQQCPNAAGIIHLGATSCYVTDNTDLLNIRTGLGLIKTKLLGVIKLLADFADKYKDLPTLGFTHFQSAALVTVGKRAALWLENFRDDVDEVDFVLEHLKLLGCRGATGTSDTFMELFEQDEEKVVSLDKKICDTFSFSDVYPVSGQTYPRKVDSRVLKCLSSICESAYKMADDIRLLQHDKEIEEPFGKNQIGSSAMAYKRNPMRCERICSLSRDTQVDMVKAAYTASTQWLERTLDDSAGRRIYIPEGFLTTDAVLIICSNVIDGLVVYPKIIEKHIKEELPFMATEKIIMEGVKKGGDRQTLHERIRIHSMEAKRQINEQGLNNDLVDRIAADPLFRMTKEDIEKLLDPKKMTGRCASQVTDFLEKDIYPLLRANKENIENIDTTVSV